MGLSKFRVLEDTTEISLMQGQSVEQVSMNNWEFGLSIPSTQEGENKLSYSTEQEVMWFGHL